MTKHQSIASITVDQTPAILHCEGNWSASGIVAIVNRLQKLVWPKDQKITIDGKAISHLDSAGAWVLEQYSEQLNREGFTVALENFTPAQHSLLQLVASEAATLHQPMPKVKMPNWLYRVGFLSHQKLLQADSFFIFLGELTLTFINAIRFPKRIQWRSILSMIDQTGYGALPIIALLSFLIGVVLTYQMGLQLRIYGANIYIVNLSGMAIFREFAPLISAIIVAGRTSSAYTAHIGTMKVNEEIDALRTMGVSPINRLVVPRILGLIIAFPLLTFWSDIFGILGSMVMAKGMLSITYYDFLYRLQRVVSIDNYYIGLSKAPVFALIIGAVGCFQGFRVSFSADSVGHQTTRSVVQAIFFIIVADALFSIFFSMAGI